MIILRSSNLRLSFDYFVREEDLQHYLKSHNINLFTNLKFDGKIYKKQHLKSIWMSDMSVLIFNINY